MNRSILTLVADCLRRPGALVDDAAEPEALAWMVPRMLLVIVIGAMVFGAVVGAWRGGIQTLYAAIKMPALLVLPLVVGLPAVRALFSTSEEVVAWPRLAVAGLVGAVRTAVLAAALAPVLWLLWSVIGDYHVATLVFTLAVVGVGLQGLVAVRHALPRFGVRHVTRLGVAVVVLGLATAQSGWLLRPFVARPGADIAFLRPIEGNFAAQLAVTGRSATGDYRGWEPERGGAFGHMRRGR